MILVFNKTDVQSHEFAHEWMTDFEAFQTALRKDEDTELAGGSGSGYMGNLLNSMSLMLEEFYKHLNIVGVSAMTGTGIDDFLEAVKGKVDEYDKEYKPELEALRKKRDDAKAAKQQSELDKLLKDMHVNPSTTTGGTAKVPRDTDEDDELVGGVHADVLSDLDSDDGELVDRDEDEPDHDGEDADPEDGLQARYQKALAEDRTKKEGDAPGIDESFMRYLKASKS